MLGKTFDLQLIDFPDYETEEGETRYYLTPDGKFPSMTSILKVLDDGGIDRWVERVGEEEAERVKTEASDRGNALHDYIEAYLLNSLDRKQMHHKKAKMLFNRMVPYFNKIDVVFGTEVALYSPELGYAGRTDAIAGVGSDIVIVDHKNSRRPIDLSKQYARRKLFKYQLQCAGYSLGLENATGMRATKGMITVGNVSSMNADQFYFDLEPFYDEFFLLIDGFYKNPALLSQSLYYKL
jgi:hypothetical protein